MRLADGTKRTSHMCALGEICRRECSFGIGIYLTYGTCLSFSSRLIGLGSVAKGRYIEHLVISEYSADVQQHRASWWAFRALGGLRERES